MLDELTKSTVVPINENKGDIQKCSDCCNIKSMSPIISLSDRKIDIKSRQETNVSEELIDTYIYAKAVNKRKLYIV